MDQCGGASVAGVLCDSFRWEAQSSESEDPKLVGRDGMDIRFVIHSISMI